MGANGLQLLMSTVFYVKDHEIHGQQISNQFGELLEGRLSGCLKCHMHFVGLWSCSIQVKNEYDVTVLNKIVEDIDSNSLSNLEISKNHSYQEFNQAPILGILVLNEYIHSHLPKRRSEGVVIRSILKYNGVMVKVKENMSLNYKKIHLTAGIQTIGMID